MVVLVSAAFALTSSFVTPDITKDSLQRYIYPLSKPISAPDITIDVKDAPDMEAWAETAKDLATAWFPKLCELLSTANYKAPTKLTFVFRNKQDAPAYATGSEISFNATWIRAHPDDLGMVVHELTHIVQRYPRNKVNTGWLVEGIADYTRWWRYEPEAPRSRINFEKATYHDAYRTTAWFLAWSGQKYNQALVPTLDAKLRAAEDPMPVFEQLTGKTADTLWSEFAAAVGPIQR